MRKTILSIALLLPLSGEAAHAQCVSSHRAAGAHSNFSAIQIVLPSNMPTNLQSAFRGAMDNWSSSDCNTNYSFPTFQDTPAGAGRTISVTFTAGLNPRDRTSCGEFQGNVINMYGQARVNGILLPCDRVDVFGDNATHELGHVLGLVDQYGGGGCASYIMSQTAFTASGSYIDRSLHSAECQKVDETQYTPAEQLIDLCGAPDCNPMCEIFGCTSPIVIDLRGDGFDLTSVDRGVRFDLDADGLSERTAWTASRSHDAFLVLDRNGNGVVDDGSELFGDHTPFLNGTIADNGYNVLFEYDAVLGNANGFIDPGDSIYRALRLWVDRNHDGISQPSEVRSLAAAGIVALSTGFIVSLEEDQYGNQHRFRGVAYLRDAQGQFSEVPTVDVYFRSDR